MRLRRCRSSGVYFAWVRRNGKLFRGFGGIASKAGQRNEGLMSGGEGWEFSLVGEKEGIIIVWREIAGGRQSPEAGNASSGSIRKANDLSTKRKACPTHSAAGRRRVRQRGVNGREGLNRR